MKWVVSKPEFTSAGTNAVGPGNTCVCILFLIHVFIKICPGSDMPGVPASDISAIFLLLIKSSIISLYLICSLSLLNEINCLFMLRWFNNFIDILVSSHNM